MGLGRFFRASGSRMTRDRDEEVSPRWAAEYLGVHLQTVYRWCRDAIDGKTTRVRHVRRDFLGRFWLKREEIRSLTLERVDRLGLEHGLEPVCQSCRPHFRERLETISR